MDHLTRMIFKHVSVQILEELYRNGNWDEKYIHIRKRTNFKIPFSWIFGRKYTIYFCTNFINTQEKLQDTIVHLSPKKFTTPNYILLQVFYRKITFLSRSKRNGFETSSSIFNFLFQKLKEDIISHPQVEMMRCLIN